MAFGIGHRQVTHRRGSQGRAGHTRVRLLLRHQRVAGHAAVSIHRKRSHDESSDGNKSTSSRRRRGPGLRGGERVADVDAQGGRVHRPGEEAVLPLPAVDVAAHAGRADAGMAGKKQPEPVRSGPRPLEQTPHNKGSGSPSRNGIKTGPKLGKYHTGKRHKIRKYDDQYG